MGKRKFVAGAIVAGTLVPALAMATNGYFPDGYGMKAEGMGGASTAMAEDAFGGATNPAKMVFVGNRLDIGVDLFSPRRSAERVGGTGAGASLNGSATSGSNYFLIPQFGYNKMINPNMSLGVTVYGNGGMNTDYPGGQLPAAGTCAGFNKLAPGPYNLLCGNGNLNMDMMQLIIAPTAAFKLAPTQSIGISPLFAYQRFKMVGLQGFHQYTTSGTANYLTDQGYDNSTGWGVRIGWMGKMTERLTLGAAYSTKISMSKFDKYRELFADQGMFDIPENYSVGLAFKAIPAVTLAFDYQRINYGKISSIANPSTNYGSTIPGTLGVSGGRGFGWSDINVYKLGVEYVYSDKLTLRAGVDHGDNPIQARDVTFNIIAPGVVRDHATLGFTYKVGKRGELTMAYMHAFTNSVTGSSLFATQGWVPTAGNEKIQMYEDSIGIAYGWKM